MMPSSFLTHPATTFLGGALVATGAILALLQSCSAPNDSAQRIDRYRGEMDKVPASGLAPGSAAEKEAIDRFTRFLTGIGDANFIRENAPKTYAADAYLDDTLSVHQGLTEIQAYFVKTSETMKSYEVKIDDVARSGEDFYVRWTMIFSAPALSGGEPVHSAGVSQVRFDREGKVRLHQDFWDSGQNFHAHLPIVGGAVGFVRKRMQSN